MYISEQNSKIIIICKQYNFIRDTKVLNSFIYVYDSGLDPRQEWWIIKSEGKANMAESPSLYTYIISFIFYCFSC